MSKPTVFVTSTTGTLGFALASHLCSLSYSVRAIVRDTSSPQALSLSQLGVSLFPGSWDDLPSLDLGLSTCTHLFLNTVPSFNVSPTHERTQALNILQAAKSAGVKHVVYTSALAVNRIPEVSVFEETSPLGIVLRNKEAIEHAVRTTGFDTWTILRPASFMENFLVPKVAMYPGLVETRVWTIALLEGKKLPLVDAGSVAHFVTRAFEESERFGGKEIELAGDELAPEDIMRVLGGAVGQEMRFKGLTEEEIEAQRKVNPMIGAQLALRELGRFVKTEDTKAWGVEMCRFGEFLEGRMDDVRRTYGNGVRL